MKKILATLALLLGAFHILSAVPAYPGKIRVTQPDGSVITIRIHGDEWFHYVTDDSGQVVARGADGFYRPAQMPSAAQRAEALRMREEAGRMRAQAASAAKAGSMSMGTHRIPVILVEFQDVPFVISDPRAAFDALLNQEGYSANGGTGSVRDFYVENSHGQYDPVFDVFGPYTLSKNSADYVNNAGGALVEACQAMNADIDFSRYDSDGDGYVDMTLMYYAGHNAAETGLENEQIWPHQGYAGGSTRLDGKRIYKYFCTSELKGYSGSNMCGIGTTTHEFAHSLGLPDFYDTDYSTNGSAGGLYSYSTMCSGPYNNNGRTPPYFNAEELIMLGWMDGYTEIESQGSRTVTPVQNRVAYRIPTSTDGEYFVLECRGKTGWDSALPGNGLLVYHVDKSQRQVTILQAGWGGETYESTYAAAALWNNWQYTNAINENGSHPCFYIVPAADVESLNFPYNEDRIPFPGSRKITRYTPVDWEGVQTDFKFTDISFATNRVTLTVSYTTTPGIQGCVMNTSAKPVRDAKVELYAGTSLKKSATTGADGTFSFLDAALADATYTVKVSCSGYEPSETEVTLGRKVESLDIYLRKEGESPEATFIKYDPDGETVPFGASEVTDIAAAILLSAEETAPYAGKQLKSISFQPAAGSGAVSAYVFVESGGRRQFTQRVDNLRLGEMNTVNVVAQEYCLPSGSSLYVGYALLGCNGGEPIMVQHCTSDKMGYYGTYNGTRAITWTQMGNLTPILSADVGEPVLPELGFNHIANPGNGVYRAGDRFDLTLVRYEDDAPSSVSWVFDGSAVQGGSVTLTAGSHTVEAHLAYPDGTAEVIRLVLKAE
ncbi:MAG: M6 family metalloprotease domain-containing protein [Bacteroidales bacterium]|nr:M6 family metalloprotease domain-containing protein [Bacteroidales bacterium]